MRCHTASGLTKKIWSSPTGGSRFFSHKPSRSVTLPQYYLLVIVHRGSIKFMHWFHQISLAIAWSRTLWRYALASLEPRSGMNEISSLVTKTTVELISSRLVSKLKSHHYFITSAAQATRHNRDRSNVCSLSQATSKHVQGGPQGPTMERHNIQRR